VGAVEFVVMGTLVPGGVPVEDTVYVPSSLAVYDVLNTALPNAVVTGIDCVTVFDMGYLRFFQS
jgi:hypothetical protein